MKEYSYRKEKCGLQTINNIHVIGEAKEPSSHNQMMKLIFDMIKNNTNKYSWTTKVRKRIKYSCSIFFF